MEINNDCAVLNDIYKNAQTGCQGISDLMPRVTNSAFRSDLVTQGNEYKAIAHLATDRLIEMGDTPSEIGPMQRVGMWAAVTSKTMMNSDTSHLAEMMITGSTMGITNMTKVLNSYQNPNPQVKTLADQLINTEHQNIERLKAYLH